MDLTAVVPKDMWGVYIPVFEKPDHKCLINIGSVTATRREVTTLCRSAKDDGDDTSASTVRRRTPRKQFPSSTPASGSSARVTRSTARGQLALPQPSIEDSPGGGRYVLLQVSSTSSNALDLDIATMEGENPYTGTVRQTRLKTLCAKNYRGSDDEWAQIVSYVFGQLRKAHWIRRFGLSKKRSGSAEGEGKHVVWLDGADQLQGYLSCSMETGAPLNAPMESSQFEEGCASSSTIVPQTQSGVGVQAPQSPTSEVPESLTAMSQRHNAKPKFRARNNRNNEKQKPATQAGQQDSVLSKRYHCAVCDVSCRDAASLRIHNKSKRHAKKMEMGDSDYNCDLQYFLQIPVRFQPA
ncbi:hypothetical protein CDV55_106290 [Aspergillus turcosus]|nr:hypothetical protein CDV55_106290 [Aspergillus turcosus]